MAIIVVRKSYGKMRGSRYKMKASGKPTVNRFLAKFAVGDAVHIEYLPSSTIPHPRFQGLTGHVVEKRGDSYAVAVKDGNKPKMLFLKPEHLRRSVTSSKSQKTVLSADLRKSGVKSI